MKVGKASQASIEALFTFLENLEEKIDDDDTSVTDLRSFVDWIHSNIPIHWRAIVFGYQVLLDNACDPELNYLEFKPELRGFIADSKDMESVDLW